MAHLAWMTSISRYLRPQTICDDHAMLHKRLVGDAQLTEGMSAQMTMHQCMQMGSRCQVGTWRRSRGQLIVQLCPSHSHQGTHLRNAAQAKNTSHLTNTHGHCSSCSGKPPNVDKMYLCHHLSGWGQCRHAVSSRH